MELRFDFMLPQQQLATAGGLALGLMTRLRLPV